MDARELVAPTVTPQQATEACDRLLPALANAIGPGMRYVADLLTLSELLSPHQRTMLVQRVEEYADMGMPLTPSQPPEEPQQDIPLTTEDTDGPTAE